MMDCQLERGIDRNSKDNLHKKANQLSRASRGSFKSSQFCRKLGAEIMDGDITGGFWR